MKNIASVFRPSLHERSTAARIVLTELTVMSSFRINRALVVRLICCTAINWPLDGAEVNNPQFQIKS